MVVDIDIPDAQCEFNNQSNIYEFSILGALKRAKFDSDFFKKMIFKLQDGRSHIGSTSQVFDYPSRRL